jgi:transposase
MVEDLPISGKRVSLHVPRRKVRCPEDRTIRVEEIAWISIAGYLTQSLKLKHERLKIIKNNY